MTPTKKSQFPYYLQLVAALGGIALSLYLVVQHTRLKMGIQGSASFCSFGDFANCDIVNGSQYSEVMGIPLAVIGALFFSMLLFLGLAARPGTKHFRAAQRWMAWLAAAGLLVDLGLLGIQLFSLKSLCLMCTLTYVCTMIHLIANAKQSESGDWFLGAFRGGVSPFPRLPGTVFGMTALGTLGVALIVAIVNSSAKANRPLPKITNGGPTPEQMMAVFLQNWKTMPPKDVPVRSTDGSFGNPKAKVRVVSFSDFECPYCQRAAFTIHTALKPMEDKVQVVFKHFPLDSTCNPALQQPMHPNACALANLAYCANKKGKFWPYHDLVFFKLQEKGLRGSHDELAASMKEIFTPADFKACMENAEARQSTRADIDLGLKLEVRATPSVFINGKQVSIPLTVESVRKLVELELNASS